MKSANWRDRRFMDVVTDNDDNNADKDNDDDDDDGESIDGWIMSPASSQGRSSISSIPWAEDAIKQNQDEWDAIEEMFYGERPLPNDPKIRQEFTEWMTKFPHLRIVGRQIVSADTASATKSSDDLVGNQIELCMRITSGPLLAKRGKSGRQLLMSSSRSDWPSSSVQLMKETVSNNRVASSVRSELLLDERQNAALRRQVPTTLSARIIKMPAILNISNFGRRAERVTAETTRLVEEVDEEPSSRRMMAETSRRPLQSRLTLPAIQLNRTAATAAGTFHTELIGRSISAIQPHQQTTRSISLRRRTDQF